MKSHGKVLLGIVLTIKEVKMYFKWLPLSYIFSVVLVLTSCIRGESATASDLKAVELENNIDSLMLPLVNQKLISGTIFISINDNIIVHKAYGMASVERGIPNTEKTKYPIASITKMFTGVSILQLYERGKLDLQDKLSKYLPDFPQGDKIIIYHLLTHTSGIPSFNSVEEENTDFNGLIKRIKGLPLKFEPGTDVEYSNSGMVLLAFIIEKVSGQPYEDFVNVNIFKPGMMNQSGILPADTSETVDNLAQGYTFNNSGEIQPAKRRNPVGKGEGSLYSTAADMNKFSKALFSNNLILKKTLNLMTKPSKQKFNESFGMGCMIENYKGWNAVYHRGGMVGYKTLFKVYIKSDAKITIINLFNTDFMLSDLVDAQIEKIALGESWKPAFFKDQKLIELFQKFIGVYEISPDDTFTITLENGEVNYQENGQPKYIAFPYSETSLFIRGLNARIHFAEDKKNGKVTFTGFYGTPVSVYMVTGTRKEKSK